jgi:hypothetical protein
MLVRVAQHFPRSARRGPRPRLKPLGSVGWRRGTFTGTTPANGSVPPVSRAPYRFPPLNATTRKLHIVDHTVDPSPSAK